jgi:hypothetical protein
MDKWEDYPIKVLDMAPLIMVTLPMVSSFSSTCGCFLRVEQSFSRTISLLFSLSSLRTASQTNGSPLANGGASKYLGLKGLQAQEKRGKPTLRWARPAVLGRSTQAHPGPVRSHLRSHGSSCIYALCPLHLQHFDDVILASKMEVLLAWFRSFTLQSSRMSFVTLQSLPPLGVISSSS